jgi:hypothetical protein
MEGGVNDDNIRTVLRFTLRPGESLKEHNAPNSPFYVVVLQGKDIFPGKDEQETEFGPNSLRIFNARENHPVRALDEDLVFVGFMHGAPRNISARVGGLLAHEGECVNQARWMRQEAPRGWGIPRPGSDLLPHSGDFS